jgi:hypothetical protein
MLDVEHCPMRGAAAACDSLMAMPADKAVQRADWGLLDMGAPTEQTNSRHYKPKPRISG